MKKLINRHEDVVRESLEGLVATSENLSLLPSRMSIVRADIDTVRAGSHVSVISGGGAGHEPAHAGYVGAGLLSGAVSGEVFTSPSADAVLEAIHAVAGPAGVLILVKNYTGDILNFGLAAQIAASEGIDVRMVVVRDDVALLDLHDQDARRGLAGTILVHKVAGAAAQAGRTLDEVTAIAQSAADRMFTMGVGLGSCTVPAAGVPNFNLDDDEIEWGLGIHGESGMERSAMVTADELVAGLLRTILRHSGLGAGARVALLVNNLGGTPKIELDIAARAALRELAAVGIDVELVWVGSYLTALEMPGCSVSVLELTDEIAELLHAPAHSAAWKAGVRPQPFEFHDSPSHSVIGDPADAQGTPGESGPTPVSDQISDREAFTLIEAACTALIEADAELTRMDQIVGDGDLGASLTRGSQAIRAELPRIAESADYSFAEVLAQLSATVRKAMGGTSGPLYASLLLGAAVTLREQGDVTPTALAAAFQDGVSSVTRLGGAVVGDRTMMDALIPAAEAFGDTIHGGAALPEAIDAAVAAAESGTESTAQMTANKGRSRYIGERALGTADPGAHAVVVWLKAIRAAYPVV